MYCQVETPETECYLLQRIINIKNSKWKNDHSVLDKNGKSEVDSTIPRHI